MSNNTVIVIPARLESTRLARKVLLDIHGQTMLERVWHLAIAAQVGEVFIATDSDEITHAANLFGAQVVKTGEHDSGTSRIASIIDKLSLDPDSIVINLQADEPLLPIAVIQQLASFAHSTNASAASICSYNDQLAAAEDPSVVKVVCQNNGDALYFSRQLIPHQASNFLQHHGIYAYKAATLKQWAELKPTVLEQAERLEQLRLIENGYRIAMHKVKQALPTGVDTVADLERVRELMQ